MIAAELNHSHNPPLTTTKNGQKSFTKLEDLVDYIDRFEEKIIFGKVNENRKDVKKWKKKFLSSNDFRTTNK